MKTMVEGTVTVRYKVEVDVADLSEDAMTMDESDSLISKAIDKQLPSTLMVEGDIRVHSSKRID